MAHKTPTLLALLVSLLILAACGAPAPTATPTAALSASDQIATIVAQTQVAEAALPTPAPVTATLPATAAATAAATATPTSTKCTNAAALVSEADTGRGQYSPGAPFAKTWTLQNTGTCAWTTEYQLVFSSGDAMQSAPAVAFPAHVQPQETVELVANLSAPQHEGHYSGNWMLRAPNGALFGLDGQNIPLLAQIDVKAGATPPNTGPAAYSDTFDSNTQTWFLGADENIDFEIQDGHLSLSALQPTGDLWRVLERPVPADLYLQASFRTGSSCSGEDSYGFFVRTPETSDRAYNSGYVFGVSCDGQYRFYGMDDGVYRGILNWTSSPALLQGPNVMNTLGIELAGSAIRLYANNTLLIELTDDAHPEGRVGLVVRSADTPGFQVFVEDFAYWTIQ